MLFTSPDSVEEYIITILGSGSIKTTELIDKINTIRPGTTKQAVYFALRDLRKAEVVVSHGMKSTLNIRWLNNLEGYLNIAKEKYYTGQTETGSFQNIKDGERIEYYFHNLLETDAFWWQALYQFIIFSQTNEPAYLYNPHEWFLIARRESDLEVIETVVKKGKQLLLTTGGTTVLDKYIANDFDGNNSQYYMSTQPLFKKNNYYLNIVDDFLIEVWIDKNLADKVEVIYNTTTQYSEEVQKQLESLIHQKSKGRLVISKSYKKTQRIKKMLSKHFYIKQN